MLECRASVVTDIKPMVRMREILGDQGPARVVISGKIAAAYRR